MIAALFPFIVPAFLESILRLSGFGNTYPLFIESSYKTDYLQTNPDVVKRFFHQPELAPPVGPDTFLIKKEKDTNSLRNRFTNTFLNHQKLWIIVIALALLWHLSQKKNLSNLALTYMHVLYSNFGRNFQPRGFHLTT